MFNFKASGIAAGAAFVISLLLGLVSGSGFPVLLFRALGFGAFFFILFCAVFWLAGQFVPELFSASGDPFDPPGSRVNLAVGSEPIEGAFPAENTDEVDNIDGRRVSSDRSSARAGEQPDSSADSSMDFSASAVEDLDQNGEVGYNEEGPVSAGEPAGKGAGRNSAEVDLVPDFDTLSEAFLPDTGSDSPEPAVFDVPEQKTTGSRVSRNQNFRGDFDPKELAQAIRTVLKKEEKG